MPTHQSNDDDSVNVKLSRIASSVEYIALSIREAELKQQRIEDKMQVIEISHNDLKNRVNNLTIFQTGLQVIIGAIATFVAVIFSTRK